MKLPAAVRAFFAAKGREGGKTRASRLSAQRRKEIARQAARTRWKAKKQPSRA
jgi:hypothetical protein